MDELKPLAVFAEVVDAGSMSAAARRLGMSPSAVSQTIRALEANGGVALLHRSTRKLALTEAGGAATADPDRPSGSPLAADSRPKASHWCAGNC
jgi:DNA-binding MarR family transcriptional regulator